MKQPLTKAQQLEAILLLTWALKREQRGPGGWYIVRMFTVADAIGRFLVRIAGWERGPTNFDMTYRRYRSAREK